MSSNIQKRVQVLYVEARKSAKGNAYHVAQCVVFDKEGIPKVGELWSFNKELTIVPGEFHAEFEIAVDMDRKVSANLVAMHPLKSVSSPAPAPAATK
jgi:hypothetical protein